MSPASPLPSMPRWLNPKHATLLSSRKKQDANSPALAACAQSRRSPPPSTQRPASSPALDPKRLPDVHSSSSSLHSPLSSQMPPPHWVESEHAKRRSRHPMVANKLSSKARRKATHKF